MVGHNECFRQFWLFAKIKARTNISACLCASELRFVHVVRTCWCSLFFLSFDSFCFSTSLKNVWFFFRWFFNSLERTNSWIMRMYVRVRLCVRSQWNKHRTYWQCAIHNNNKFPIYIIDFECLLFEQRTIWCWSNSFPFSAQPKWLHWTRKQIPTRTQTQTHKRSSISIISNFLRILSHPSYTVGYHPHFPWRKGTKPGIERWMNLPRNSKEFK